MDGEIKVSTKIDESGLDKGLRSVSQKIQSIGNSKTVKGLSNIGMSLTGIGLAGKAVTGALQAVDSTIKELSNAYNKQATAEAQLQQAAKNNPYLLPESVKQLKNYASELQSMTVYGDEELLPFMAQLAAAGRTQDEIMQIMDASVNLAASGTMSLDAAVDALNKTYNGNVGLLGNQISGLKNLNSEQLKSGAAVKIVAERYAGMAEEVAKTAGSSQQLNNAIGDLKEEVGAAFEKGVTPIRGFFTELIGGWASALKARREYEAEDDRIKSGTASAADYVDHVKNAEEKLAATRVSLEAARQELLKEYNFQRENAGLAKVTDDSKEFIKLVNTLSSFQYADKEGRQGLSKAQSSYAQTIALYNDQYKKLAQLRKEQAEQAAKEAKAAQEAAEAKRKADEEAKAKAAQESRDTLRQKYDEEIAAKKKEIELRKSAGEKITEEAEAQELYNTAFAAYIKMMSDPAFAGNKGTYEHEVNARKDIEAWAKTAGQGALKTQIEDFNRDLEAAADKAAGVVKNQYDIVLQTLDEEFKAVIENKYLEEEAKLKLEQEYEEKRKGIVKARDDAEKAELKQKIDNLSAGNDTYWTRYSAKMKELADLEKEVTESTVLDADEKEKEKTRIVEAQTQARKELVAAVVADYAQYVQQAVQIMKDAANIMLETAQNRATAEQAQLELSYRKGEISTDEYNKKLTESKKKAAKEEYKIQMWQWAASCAMAAANIAQGITAALSQVPPASYIMAAATAAAGAVQIASVTAAKPIPPSFTTGGIIAGSSTHGDNIAANLNSREMVMNMSQQKGLWDFINGGSQGSGGSTNIVINNSASNVVSARPQITKDAIEIMIDARVNDSLKNGRYDKSLNMAEQGMTGEYYGI